MHRDIKIKMLKTVTMSFSAPLELSIQMEEYMELKGLNRSELIKSALSSYIRDQGDKRKAAKLLEEIHKDVIEMREKLQQLTDK